MGNTGISKKKGLQTLIKYDTLYFGKEITSLADAQYYSWTPLGDSNFFNNNGINFKMFA